jgi:benzylsuccinate CoA-transferase BbsE subunit
MPDEPDRPSALDDIRVLDISGEMGLYCTKLLADLGADVIQVEPPGGHPARRIGPFYHDETDAEKSLYFWNLTTSKRSITLNLEDSDGRDLLRRLVRTADVVVETFPPGYLDGLGLGYEGLCRIKPDIVLTSITGFGQWGPHSHYLAPDIVGVAMSGVMWMAGFIDDPPNLLYGQQAYLSASIQAAAGTLMAVYHRDLTGEGQHVDVSMQEAISIAQETGMQTWDMRKEVRGRGAPRQLMTLMRQLLDRQSSIPGIGPYECKDGWVWCYVGTPGGAPWTDLRAWMVEEGKAQDLFEEPHKSFVDNLSMPFLTGLWLDPEGALRMLPELVHVNEVLKGFFASKTAWEAYEEGQERRLLIGIISTPEDLVRNPQLNFRGYYKEVHHPELADTLRYPGPPYVLSETPAALRRRSPLIGEHNEEVYCGELGLTRQEFGALYGAGAI